MLRPIDHLSLKGLSVHEVLYLQHDSMILQSTYSMHQNSRHPSTVVNNLKRPVSLHSTSSYSTMPVNVDSVPKRKSSAQEKRDVGCSNGLMDKMFIDLLIRRL